MSDLILHTKKKSIKEEFDEMVMVEYECCIDEINHNIRNGKNETRYTVTINKIQKDWKPLKGTYEVLIKLKNADYFVFYEKPTTLIILHKQKKVMYNDKHSNKKILKILQKENNKSRRILYQEGKLL